MVVGAGKGLLWTRRGPAVGKNDLDSGGSEDRCFQTSGDNKRNFQVFDHVLAHRVLAFAESLGRPKRLSARSLDRWVHHLGPFDQDLVEKTLQRMVSSESLPSAPKVARMVAQESAVRSQQAETEECELGCTRGELSLQDGEGRWFGFSCLCSRGLRLRPHLGPPEIETLVARGFRVPEPLKEAKRCGSNFEQWTQTALMS